jgi:hypothetical protein
MVHVAQDDSFMAEVVSREKGGSPRRRGSKERGVGGVGPMHGGGLQMDGMTWAQRKWWLVG